MNRDTMIRLLQQMPADAEVKFFDVATDALLDLTHIQPCKFGDKTVTIVGDAPMHIKATLAKDKKERDRKASENPFADLLNGFDMNNYRRDK